MPTYDYQCDACDHKFELFQSITAPAVKKCPSCGKLKVRRLIGAGAGVIFKGSGFYQTDYRSDSYRKAAEADKPSKAESPSPAKSGEKADKPAPVVQGCGRLRLFAAVSQALAAILGQSIIPASLRGRSNTDVGLRVQPFVYFDITASPEA